MKRQAPGTARPTRCGFFFAILLRPGYGGQVFAETAGPDRESGRPTSQTKERRWISAPGLRRPLRFTGPLHRCLCLQREKLVAGA